jgi:formate-dependent nitrite reductase membrane component NrfD
MNPFVADPQWGWWITLYFFLGGLAAGSYFVATLIEIFGQDEDRPLARIGYRLAFPLICVCGIFLIVDLNRPERFWHMMFQSEVVHKALSEGWPRGGWGTMASAPILKWWSPMSIGAWAIALFGAWSCVSFVTSFWQNSLLARLLGRNLFGHLFRMTGSGIGFFIASYTGVLLSATNQPLWSLSDWIAPLFLTSAGSTALAALLLLGHKITPASRTRLERADLWALGLELGLFLIFLASLGNVLTLVLATWQGWVLVAGTLILGILAPLLLHFGSADRAKIAAGFALVGGFLLRFGIVNTAPALLRLPPEQALAVAGRLPYKSGAVLALMAVTIVLALGIPVLLRRQWRLDASGTLLTSLASVAVLTGVFFYSFALSGRQHFLEESRVRQLFPEDGRVRGGGVGASPFNRPDVIQPRSKIEKDATP